jgi:hypothetical protein
LRVKLTRNHLSAISGITLNGRLFLQMQDDDYDADGVVGFLRVLLRKIHGKVLVIWDGSPIHKGQPIRNYLARGAAVRLHLELLEAGGTGQCLLRRSDRFASPSAACGRTRRHKPEIIRACSQQCGYLL